MSALTHIRRIVAATLAGGILILGTATTAVASTAATPPVASSVVSAVDDREGPQFYNGVVVEVTGTVDGDVYASGQSVTISGDVTGDVIAAAQTITITGSVDGNVRLAAQSVTINGDVSRSATVFSSDLTIADAGSLGDDVVGAAGSVVIAGEVGRDVVLSVGRLRIRGSVGGDVTYYSDTDATITGGAVSGTVERIAPPQAPKVEVSPWAVVAGWLLGVLYALFALSLITLLAGLAFPRWLQRVTDHLVPTPWKALLVGLVASFAFPVAALFLLVTIVGAPLALAAMLVWLVLTLATFVYGAYYLGRLVFRGTQHPVVQSLVGGVILIAALQIPWLNILVWLGMVFFGLGAQLLEFYSQRPWSRTPAQVSAPAPTPAEPAPPYGP